MQKLIQIPVLVIVSWLLIVAPAYAEVVAPKISVAPIQYYPLDEILYLEGRAFPNSHVEIYFERMGGDVQPVRVTVKANSNGEWYFSDRLELASGEWMVRVRSTNPHVSDWSNPQIIRSVVSGFIFGSLKIKYLPVVLTIVTLLLISFALVLYSLIRVRSVNRLALEREMREKTAELERKLRRRDRESVATLVERSFEEIRNKIADELEHLESKRRDSNLLPEEEEHHAKLLRDFRKAEEEIEKEIKSIT